MLSNRGETTWSKIDGGGEYEKGLSWQSLVQARNDGHVVGWDYFIAATSCSCGVFMFWFLPLQTKFQTQFVSDRKRDQINMIMMCVCLSLSESIIIIAHVHATWQLPFKNPNLWWHSSRAGTWPVNKIKSTCRCLFLSVSHALHVLAYRPRLVARLKAYWSWSLKHSSCHQTWSQCFILAGSRPNTRQCVNKDFEEPNSSSFYSLQPICPWNTNS